MAVRQLLTLHQQVIDFKFFLFQAQISRTRLLFFHLFYQLQQFLVMILILAAPCIIAIYDVAIAL